MPLSRSKRLRVPNAQASYRRAVITLIMVVALIAPGGFLAPATAQDAATPAATPVVDTGAVTLARFDASAGELSEGIAVDADGTVYASLSPLGQLVRIGDDGSYEVVGAVDGLQEGDLGLAGLAVDPAGNVCGGVSSANPDAIGVWCFDAATGEATRVNGTEQIGFANGLDFDDAGNMYVADTPAGAIWLVPAGGTAQLWLQDPLVSGDGSLGLGFPLGANVPAVSHDGSTLYVTVTEPGHLVAIPIEADGSAGTPTVFAEFRDGDIPIATDGVAIDSAGNLIVMLMLTNTVVRVAPDGTIETVATVADGLDGPASVVIGPNADGVESMFIANYDGGFGALIPPGPGPGVVMIPLDR